MTLIQWLIVVFKSLPKEDQLSYLELLNSLLEEEARQLIL